MYRNYQTYQLPDEEGDQYVRGFREGMDAGLREGIDVGLARGLEKGIEKGMEKGAEKGARDRAQIIARRMLERGFDKETVLLLVGDE